MNDLDLAVLHRASTNGLHSVSMLLDANDEITVTVTSPTPNTTMKSIIRIGNNAADCSFSFSEKELKHGGKVERTSHIIYCETVTDIVQILDKFRTHLAAAYVDSDELKRNLFDRNYKVNVTAGKITSLGSTMSELGDAYVQVGGLAQTTNHTPKPAPPDAPLWGAHQPPAKKEDDLPFNTDLDEEDKT